MKTTFSIIAKFLYTAFQCIVAEKWDSGFEEYCFKEKTIYLEKANN